MDDFEWLCILGIGFSLFVLIVTTIAEAVVNSHVKKFHSEK